MLTTPNLLSSCFKNVCSQKSESVFSKNYSMFLIQNIKFNVSITKTTIFRFYFSIFKRLFKDLRALSFEFRRSKNKFKLLPVPLATTKLSLGLS